MKRISLPLCSSLLLICAPAFAQTAAPLPPPPPPPMSAVPPGPPPAAAPPAAAPPAAPPPAAAPPAAAPPAAPYPPAPFPPPPLAATPADAGGPRSASAIELTTLGILRDKGIISQAEYDSAIKDLTESIGEKRARESNAVVMGKWATTLYGFVEADHIIDSTQSFNDFAGNGLVAYPTSYAGKNGRVQFGIRNSRFGVRMKAPEYSGIRATAQMEMDFIGNAGLAIGAPPGYVSEGSVYSSALFRVRHANVKIETPIVDILAGQTWALFGWQPAYNPNTVEIQGVPGELFFRTAQFRVSKTIKTSSILFEAAVAALRPPQRNSETPEGQAGLRFGLPGLSAIQTIGSTGTSIAPLSVAVTGDVRAIRLPNYYKPTDGDASTSRMGSAVAVDAFIPVLPAKERNDISLALNGELASGYGTADLYTNLTGGAPAPQPTPPAGSTTAQAQDLDTGIAMYDRTGGVHLVQWTSYLIGAQFYLPGGKFWISGNYSHIESDNLKNGFVADPTKFRVAEDWVDGNVFADLTPAVRLGLEYANFTDTYGNGTHAVNHRGQFSAFYIF